MAATDPREHLTRYLERLGRGRGDRPAPQVLVTKGGRDFSFGDRTLPYHVASVGKLFVAVLAMQEVEAGRIELETPVATVLTGGRLDGLFVIDGVDHQAEVTLAQLLEHTSGVADYFEGKVTAGRPFLKHVLEDADRLWQPHELVDFTRDRQRPVGLPGARYHYSDTGYVLLGLLLEALTGETFHGLLHSRIFDPLGMRDSALMFRSEPANGVRPIAPMLIGRTDVSGFRSVSCDWAGGGVVSTLDDQARFSAALHGGQLISPASLRYLQRPRNRFHLGIHYGAGMMELRFEQLMPLLRGLPRPTGHLGILATHLFHDAVHDAHIVINFGGTRDMSRSFRAHMEIARMLQRGWEL